jgi:hypothetical protein
MAEQITMVLYPNDQSENGKELRLRQQYFLASASLQDILARWVEVHGEDFEGFADGNCLQLNDTHPTVAIPELMRLLMDEHGLAWDRPGITARAALPTPTTRCCPRRWSAGPWRCSASCCRAFWRSSTRSMPASCPWSRTAGPAIRSASGACRSSRRTADGGAHGLPGDRRQLLGQRRGRAAHDLLKQGLFRDFSRALAGEVQQQDQRRDPAALAGILQPGAPDAAR